jgi:hypothetical protein
MSRHRAEDDEFSQQPTQAGFTEKITDSGYIVWDDDNDPLAWAEVPEEPEKQPEPFPRVVTLFGVLAVIFGVAVLIGVILTLAVTLKNGTGTTVGAPPLSPISSPMYRPPSSVTQAPTPTQAPAEVPTTQAPPDSQTQDTQFISLLTQGGLAFTSEPEAVNEGHWVCSRIGAGTPKEVVIAAVIAHSANLGHNILPMNYRQGRHLVDSAISVYCPDPAVQVQPLPAPPPAPPVTPIPGLPGVPGPGQFTIA